MKRMIILDAFIAFFHNVLAFFYTVTRKLGFPNYGVAIICFTCSFRALIWPLSKWQAEKMEAFRKMTLHIQQIKEKHKNDHSQMQAEMALQYKKNGVNPITAVLPVLLQMPVLAGMYYAIQSFSYVGQPNFLWMKNIAIGDPLYIIPVLVALSTFVLQKNSNTNKGIGFGLPIFIGVMSVHLPAGVGIYWISGNLIQWGQKYFL